MTLLASAPVSPRSERGFTLAELLVAVVIFSIGLLALAGTAAVIMKTLTGTQARTIAAGGGGTRLPRPPPTPCARPPRAAASTARPRRAAVSARPPSAVG